MPDRQILTVWNVGQFDIDQIGCGTSLVHQFWSSKFLDKQDVGPATWVPVIVHQSSETIFIQEFLQFENQND